jgi:hypothetical protein
MIYKTVHEFQSLLQQRELKEGFSVALRSITSLEEVKLFVSLITSGLCPNGATIDLSYEITTEMVPEILKIFDSNLCPKRLRLNLSANAITDTGAIAVAEAIKSGSCRKHEVAEINMENNDITVIGINALTEALKSPECPDDFRMGLSTNHLGEEGIKPLIEALESGEDKF